MSQEDIGLGDSSMIWNTFRASSLRVTGTCDKVFGTPYPTSSRADALSQ